jgi:hypothetical protein
MKQLPCILLVTTLLAASAVSAQTAQIPQTPGQRVTVPLSDPARTGSLHVNVINGSITVKGTNRKDILIEVRRRADEEEEKPAKAQPGGLRQIAQPASFTV